MTEQTQATKDELLKLLEQNAGDDISASIAISLRRIADKLSEAPVKVPPIVIRK
jgi:hypothetical protein